MTDQAKMSAMALQNRYSLTLFIGGSLLLLAIILYGFTSFLAERRALYSDIRAQGEQLKLSLNDTIDVTQSHVFYMRHAVEQTLAHPELSNPSALKSTLRFSSGSPAGSPWENIPKSLETAVGSFHTDPDILLSDKTEQRDMIAALEMMLVVAAAHERHKVFQWSYYYDADMLWFMIYPKLPRAELFKMTGASEMRAALKSFLILRTRPL